MAGCEARWGRKPLSGRPSTSNRSKGYDAAMSPARPLLLALLTGCARRPAPPACQVAGGGAPLAESWGPRTRARVFLSGHSLLDSPLPEQLAALATGLHDDYAYEYQMLFGSPIRARSKGEREAPGYPGYRAGRNRSGENLD